METKKYLTVKQAAEYVDVTEKCVRGWIATGKLTYKQIGGRKGRILIEPSAIDDMCVVYEALPAKKNVRPSASVPSATKRVA